MVHTLQAGPLFTAGCVAFQGVPFRHRLLQLQGRTAVDTRSP